MIIYFEIHSDYQFEFNKFYSERSKFDVLMPYDETKFYDFYKTPSGILTAKSKDSTLKKLLQKCRDEKGLDINISLYILTLILIFCMNS